MRAPALLASFAAALLVAGCFLPHHHGPQAADGADDTQSEDIALHVANHNWSDVVVFAVRGSSRARLGDVTSGSQADFVVPRNLVIGGQLTVMLHPIGGPRDFSTGPILVSPGQEVDLRIENAIAQTNWSVS